MSRMFAIDLRRSSAVGAGLVLLVLGVLTMLLLGGWAGRWTAVAMSQREKLTLLWPLALAAGAWLVGRDRRGRVGELFAATPRPVWQRFAPPAAALALTVTVAYLLILAACLPFLLGSATYFNPAVLLIIAVGAVSLVAAGLLGMAVGRLLPSRVTAPAAAIGGLLFMLLPAVIRPGADSGRLAAAGEALPPGILTFMSDFQIVPARVSAAQLIWMAGLAVTGYLLLTATRRSRRLVAVLPAVLGAAVVVSLLPARTQSSAVLVADPAATAPVCTSDAPKVCVTHAHAAVLPELTGPARAALQKLSVLPDAPTTVMEHAPEIGGPPSAEPDPAVVPLYVPLDQDGSIFQPETIPLDILAPGAAPMCARPDDADVDHARNSAAGRAAGHWLGGTTPPAPTPDDGEYGALVREAFAALSALPRDEALTRVGTLRRDALRCEPDLFAALTRGAAR